MIWGKTEVNFIRELDTTDKWWCNSAVFFSVKNGKNTICEKWGSEDEDYDRHMHVVLNGKPIIQAKLPSCPTCKGMLATGYGLENIDCPELEAARICMNSEFVSIQDSAEKIKPLLGLLGDGYYVLADTLLFPSDGDGHFFYKVPDELRYYTATCCGYYDPSIISCADALPMFLYPTQSSSLIQNDRVEHYAKIMKTEKNPPRALTYHLQGYMNVLLDGHHKACAAASLGQMLPCLTIIPCHGYRFSEGTKGVDLRQKNPRIKTLYFASLEAEPEKEIRFLDMPQRKPETQELPLQRYELTGTGIHYEKDSYPTVKDLATFLHTTEKVDGLLPDFDPVVLDKLIHDDSDKADYYLEAIMKFMPYLCPERAYDLARRIVQRGDGHGRRKRVRAALLYLLKFRNDETEALIADFCIYHEEDNENSAIANSYWKDSQSF
ncbi:MAG: hypothetical protein IKD90_06845 [Clostridiales bacterium]|nr:hypothetical protein [Clostridiales bacterium]